MTTTMTLATTSLLPRRQGHGRAFVSALRAGHCAQLVAEGFLHYDSAFRELTERAPERFATLDWQGSQHDEAERLELYSRQVGRTADEVRGRFADQIGQPVFWTDFVRHFSILTEGHAHEDCGRAFCYSVLVDLQRSGDIAFVPTLPETAATHGLSLELAGVRRLGVRDSFEALIENMLRGLPIEADWADLSKTTAQVSRMLVLNRELLQTIGAPHGIELIEGIFYRFTRAYVVGCLRGIGGRIAFALELKNSEDGMSVQHMLLGAGSVNALFRFSGACFHVELEQPMETAGYLQMLLPDLSTCEFLTLIGRPCRESVTLAG
jgi:isocitrate dehydrogenase kinase/phosphatase